MKKEILLFLFLFAFTYIAQAQNNYKVTWTWGDVGNALTSTAVIEVEKENGQVETIFNSGSSSGKKVISLNSPISEIRASIRYVSRGFSGKCSNSATYPYNDCNTNVSLACIQNPQNPSLAGLTASITPIEILPQDISTSNECSPITVPIESFCDNLEIDKWYFKLEDGTKQYLPRHDGENPLIFNASELNENPALYLNKTTTFYASFKYYPFEVSRFVNILKCSPQLTQNPPTTKNATCYSSNDGEATLKFNSNIEEENDYQMRFYIFQGTPPSNPTEEQLKNPTFPNQVFDEALEETLTSDNEGNFSHTIYGLDGSYIDTNDILHNSAEYYIVYQEVKYEGLDVTVKSAEITEGFTINQPSEIIPSATITQASCDNPNAVIKFSAVGGNNLDGGGTYSYRYQLNGAGDWFEVTGDEAQITPTDTEQTVSIQAIYSINDCPSKSILLDTKINAAIPNLEILETKAGVAPSAGGPDYFITLNYEGGVPNYIFQLEKLNTSTSSFEVVANPDFLHNSINKSAQFSDLEIGTYRIVITDGNGCTETSDNTIVTASPPPTIETVESFPMSCSGDQATIAVTVSGGLTPYNYQWTINGSVSATQTTSSPQISLNNLTEPGTYVLKVASDGFTDFDDASGYVSTSIELEAPVAVVIDQGNTSITPISCFGAQDGSILVAVSGATNYEYKLDAYDDWQDLVNFTIPIATGGVYDLYLRDKDTQCEATPLLDSFLVEEPSEIIVSENTDAHMNVSSNGGNDGSIVINVSGGLPEIDPNEEYTFNWIGTGPNNTSFSSNTQNISGLTAGFYEVTVSDANSCTSATLSIEITEPGPLAINNVEIENQITCSASNDGSIRADVIGNTPITFEWWRNGSLYDVLVDQNTISDLPPGEYQLFLKDPSVPTPLESTIIELVAPSTLMADVASSSTCSGIDRGTISISNVTGGTPGALQDYTYSIDNGNSFQNSPLFENVAAGNYTVIVRDGNGCEFVQTDVTVDQYPIITWDSDNTIVVHISAAGRSDGAISPVFTGGTPPFSYNWTGPGINGTTTKDINNLMEGSYTVTVTDSNGCTLQENFEILEPGELTVVLEQTEFLLCHGDDYGEIMARIEGGVEPYTLEWYQSSLGSDNLLNEESPILGDLSAGTYFLRVTDANGIIKDANPISIAEPDLLEVSIEDTTDILCDGEATGAVTVKVDGGTPPYIYIWSNGESNQNLVGVTAGEYILEVVDDNGCSATTTAIVKPAPDPLQITDTNITHASEYQANDGSISLQLDGGAFPFDISWLRLSDNSPIGDQETISGLSAGFYLVSISDDNNCSISETYEITQPDIVEETIVRPSCHGDTNGSISILVNKGNGAFTYEWSTGATTSNIENLGAGSYTVTIDGFGDGPLTRTYILEAPLPLQVDLGENRTLCAGQELVLDASVEDGQASYTWSSDNGFTSNEAKVSLVESGTYTVRVSTPTGCSAEGSIRVDVSPEEIDAEFAASTQVFVNETVVAVDISYPLPDKSEWILPDEATILKTDNDEAEFRFDQPGEYEIGIITSRGDCWAQQTKKIIVLEADAAIKKENTENGKKLIDEFIVYPNPSSGEFTADVTLSERGNISIKVFSLTNNALIASKKDRGESSYNIPFDLSGFPAGVYAVLLETPYGKTLRKVIIK
ncbi:T9SS type A sorting domain-containing protein [Zobellia galactanivorans]|uniref:T9SS type A sorting domain-containing protein n=1 Tax=Zobellia galactanivorans (strain DSM 12802 / CCUG 47099 / CIP 106680 / NCIMB 13871 / Dsij) TaxID=63186 RepID=UPI0026E1AC31|nr:T9SS type A sorting domain-containing protein [Zobellia galactanivorans]MDO6808355.1 T9SS type A sorting domain-containing protein [Zobellia galactanivorans]